ncbi:uncharacterized protein I303_104156 [Kwoniella dejecticola CBS 10117]|uniref:Major facilitator superfamily (MFS) profile domain-containing protein n=1 Tax=Kwoniella dejecticola CBS 10117 TaxID=1296121 RepID=A0A1A6A651_9TREE|nr:uncharacterized protein I303_04866 [Kwoniella dejecticola CBS 10117]OBR85530.1 hypothetical protein I303_04866 [Kwoniella dejecticola CBS 10117]
MSGNSEHNLSMNANAEKAVPGVVEQDMAQKDVNVNAHREQVVEGTKNGRAKPGHGDWRAEDKDIEIPKNNLWIVMPTVGLVGFIAALDQSIVSTALPTIAAEFNTTPSQYSWIGTSYLLSQILMNPVNGRLTDIFGRKPALYLAVLFLLVFSALCGAAKNATWLIIARAFAGLGGGSVVSLSLIVVSDVVPLEKRGKFQGYMAATWGVAGTLGPVLGGLLTTKASWRWCFYINIPICTIALVLIFFFLKLKRTKRGDAAELRRSFDFLGLVLVMGAAALIVVGFSNAADEGFDSKSAYGVIIAGVVTTGLTVAHCITTKKNAIIPARLLRTRTPLFFTFGSFFLSVMFMPATFLLPQFFQGVGGATSLKSGVDFIPFCLGLIIFSVLAGEISTRLHIVRPLVWTGFSISALGYGLWYALLTYDVPYATQEGIQVVVAAGIGLAISSPMLVIQASMPGKDMAASTAAWTLTRSIGACIGLAIFTAVFNTGIRSRFSKIEGYGTVFTAPTGTAGYHALHDLPDGDLKNSVLKAFADSMRVCWIIGCALSCTALAITLCTKSYSLKRTYASAPSTTSNGNDLETGSPANEKDLEAGAPQVGSVLGRDEAGREVELDQDTIDREERAMMRMEDGLRDTGGSMPPTRITSHV